MLAFFIAGAIPAGSTIIAAELKIEASRVSDPAEPTVFVHRVTRSWGEGTSDAPSQEGSDPTTVLPQSPPLRRRDPTSGRLRAAARAAILRLSLTSTARSPS